MCGDDNIVYYSACLAGCSVPPDSPMVGVLILCGDDNIVYYSACHAGCSVPLDPPIVGVLILCVEMIILYITLHAMLAVLYLLTLLW